MKITVYNKSQHSESPQAQQGARETTSVNHRNKNRIFDRLCVGARGWGCLIAALLLLVPIGTWAYENDGPGYDQNAPRKIKVAKNSSGTSFAPPESSDILFVAKEGGDLGKEVWGPNGTISIPLPIDRYFGDKKKLMLSGAISKTAKLVMYVYDVDNKSSYTPAEYDVVKFNGKSNDATGREMVLYGENGAWTKVEFNIPIENVNLPTSPGSTAQNTITIDVDVKSPGYWVTAVNWASLEIEAAPPVILAHGIRSNNTTLKEVKEEIENLGLPVYSFSFPNKGNDGMAAGAGWLAVEVAKMRDKWQVDTVNIVAHSMGGLRAREYVANYGNPRTHKTDVKKVLQIATPNGGSPLANLALIFRSKDGIGNSTLNKLLYYKADINVDNAVAIDELCPKFMSVYNKDHPLKEGVDFRIVAGNVTSIVGADLYYTLGYRYLQKEENDCIVPVSSAFAIQMPKTWKISGSCDAVSHCGLVDDGARDTVRLLKEDLIEKKTCNVSLSNKKASKRKVSAVKANPINDISNAVDEGEALASGRCEKGIVTDVPFCVVAGKRFSGMLCVDNCTKMSISLLDPRGTDRSSAIECMNGLYTFDLENTTPGKWILRFIPTEVENKTAAMEYVFIMKEPDVDFKLNAQLEKSYVNVGESFKFIIDPTINGDRNGGTVTANVILPNGDISSYVARQSLTGEYVIDIVANVKGSYIISTTYDATSPEAFFRTEIQRGVAYDSTSIFTEGTISCAYDEDTNGLYDNLTVNFAVNATKAGTYRVLATLSDKEGHEITQGWTSNIVCTAGGQTFPVAFDGRAIYENGECGGYVVSSAKLFEIGENYEAVVDTHTNLFTTTDYTYNQFEHSLVAMKSGGFDTATDADGDGIYDRLDVTIPLYADDLASGSYEWSASLMDAEGVLLGTAAGNVRFTSGNGGASIAMSFDAEGIRASSLNGPYYVKNLILWGSGRTFTIGDEYATQAYKLQQWGGTPRACTVTFNANGGNGTMAAQTFTGGEAQPLTANAFTHTGYTFAGWATSAGDEVVYADKHNISVLEDTVLYAKWILNTYTVAFNANGGSGTMSAQTFTHGVAQGVSPNAFVRKHYKFTGWATSPDGDVVYADGQSITIEADATLYAVWERDARTLGGSSESSNFSQALTFTAYTLSMESGEVDGIITIKTKKERGGVVSATITAQPVNGKKETAKCSISAADGVGQEALAGLTFAAGGVTGSLNGHSVDGAIDVSKSKDAATVAVLNAFKGKSYVMALEPESATGSNAAKVNGVAGFSVVFSTKGKAKVTGSLPDGTKVSVSGQLIVGAEWCCLPVVYSKTSSLALLLWFDRSGNFDSVSGMTTWKGNGFEVKWSDEVAVSNVGNLSGTSYFHLAGAPTVINGAEVVRELLPVDVAITPAGTKWNIATAKAAKLDRYGNLSYGANPSGLKLTYTAKTGMFNGSLSFYTLSNGKLKKNSVTISGIVVNGIGYGTATLKKVGCWPVVINGEAMKASEFKVRLTGVAVVDWDVYDGAYSDVTFVSPETALEVPYGKKAVFRMEYDIPEGYYAYVWVVGEWPDAENENRYYFGTSGSPLYEGTGVAYGDISLLEGGKACTLRSVMISTGSPQAVAGSDAEWDIGTAAVNLTFKEVVASGK